MINLRTLKSLYRTQRKARRARKVQRLIDDGILTFPYEYLREKRVIIIGPAITVNEDLELFNPNEFDIIVRMNRAFQRNANDGTSTHIIYHNLTVDGGRAAGGLSLEQIGEQQTKYVVYPHADPLIASRRLVRTRRLLERDGSAQLVIPDSQSYARLRKKLGGSLPTTGAVAISSILDANVKELCVVGFTFFTTGYEVEYNPAVRTREDAQAWVRQTGLHDPNIEGRVINQILLDAERDGIEISLGKNVLSALQELNGLNNENSRSGAGK